MKKTLAEAVKGMQVKNWEVREHSNGKRVVYVRFAPKEPAITMNVNQQNTLNTRNENSVSSVPSVVKTNQIKKGTNR